jgi:ATP adenylyltransferase
MQILLEAGSLGHRIPRQTERALASGELQPTATCEYPLVEAGVPFSARQIAGVDRKQRSTAEQAKSGRDPFLPPYRDSLFVADISDSHVVLLNKFPVLRDHLLVVTRAFEPQQSLLNDADFAALWACMTELGGLGFYNGGSAAGASQSHKHLQWIPLAGGLPTAPLLESEACGFACAHARVEEGTRLAEQYRGLVEQLELADSEPYNLLLTRESMFVIPRTRHGWEGISVNAMGFAGSFLVQTPAALQKLRGMGPRQLLARVARVAGVPFSSRG